MKQRANRKCSCHRRIQAALNCYDKNAVLPRIAWIISTFCRICGGKRWNSSGLEKWKFVEIYERLWNKMMYKKKIHNAFVYLYADSVNANVAIYSNFLKYILTLDSFGSTPFGRPLRITYLFIFFIYPEKCSNFGVGALKKMNISATIPRVVNQKRVYFIF